MKIRHAVIAGAAALVIAPAAFAQEQTQASQDCASLQAQYDEAVAAATVEQLTAAKSFRDEGEKLCAEGKQAEGSAKLQEAITQIAK